MFAQSSQRYIWKKKSEAFIWMDTFRTVKHEDGSIMSVKGHGIHQKLDIMRKMDYLEILKQKFKTSAKIYSLGCYWAFQQELKHTSKLTTKWGKDNQVLE